MNVHTFTGGQVKVEVNNVRALLVTSRGAKLGSEFRLKESVR